MQLSLQPDQSLKPTSYRWFTQQICAVYADVESDIITVDCHLTQLFASENILKIHKIYDLAHYTVLVALDSVGLDLVEMDIRDILTQNDFPGDEIPVIRGSAKVALDSTLLDSCCKEARNSAPLSCRKRAHPA